MHCSKYIIVQTATIKLIYLFTTKVTMRNTKFSQSAFTVNCTIRELVLTNDNKLIVKFAALIYSYIIFYNHNTRQGTQ